MDYPKLIRESSLTIYDLLDARPDLFIGIEELEGILNVALKRLNLDYPLRTRSKVVKAAVCQALGYPVPKSFKKTQPRFLGQQFDTYVQKSNNLQIWNEEVLPDRRYVIIRVDNRSVVTQVRVVTGEIIAGYDNTGTLTHKYQAKAKQILSGSVLVSGADTANIQKKLKIAKSLPGFLPIADLFSRLTALEGLLVRDPGKDQERNRGGELHKRVSKSLGIKAWSDNGQFPDIREQLLEVKLQTASTIDLGLVCPDSGMFLSEFPGIRHRDVRYAVFYGTPTRKGVIVDHVVLSSGQDFFSYFQRFEGKVKNAKLQIPLPGNFFDETE